MERSMQYIHLQEKSDRHSPEVWGAYALALVGYDSTVQVQTAEVAGGIHNVATLVPGILYIGVGLCLIFYLSVE